MGVINQLIIEGGHHLVYLYIYIYIYTYHPDIDTVGAMAMRYELRLFLWDDKHSVNGVLLELITSYNWYRSTAELVVVIGNMIRSELNLFLQIFSTNPGMLFFNQLQQVHQGKFKRERPMPPWEN